MSTRPLLPEPVVLFLSRLEEDGVLRHRDLGDEERSIAEYCRTADPPLALVGIDVSAVADQTNGPCGPPSYFITDAGRHALAYCRFADRQPRESRLTVAISDARQPVAHANVTRA